MHANAAVAHLAFKLGFRGQGRNRVDDNHADRAGAHQRIDNLQCLLAGVGLRDQQFIQIDAQFSGIDRIKRMFRINKGADPAFFLFFGDAVQCQSRLARAFRAIDFHNTALRQTANSKGDIQPQRPGRGGLDILRGIVRAQLHDRALAELPFDLRKRAVERLLPVRVFLAVHCQKICRCHVLCFLIPHPVQGGNRCLVHLLFSCSRQKENISRKLFRSSVFLTTVKESFTKT